MSEFSLYLQLGWQHIADLDAYDHLVFITALCAVYTVRQWKQLLLLVTAFTVGHSITLALAALKLVTLPTQVIEFLIPVTIFITAINNVVTQPMLHINRVKFTYPIIVFFGLIHGLGFSNYFTALLGQEQNIIKPLLAFNIGLELGQLLIVAVVLAISSLLFHFFQTPQRHWNLFISGASAGIALVLMKETVFW